MSGRPRRPRIAGAAALLVALAVLGPISSVATAVDGGRPIGSLLNCDRPVIPPRCVSVGDDSRHFVYIDPSVPADLAASLRRAMSDVYGPTNLVMIEQDQVSGSTDVIVYAADNGQNGAAGWTYCPSDAPQGMNEHGHRSLVPPPGAPLQPERAVRGVLWR